MFFSKNFDVWIKQYIRVYQILEQQFIIYMYFTYIEKGIF